ncbi:MAG: putative membrane protein YfcA, partial [Candidatus Binatia bacterium]
MNETTATIVAAVAVAMIGVSKAGFGGGLGMLTTPVCVLALTAKGHSPVFALGVLLPLLIAGDTFSLLHYRGKWRWQNLKFLLPGILLGVIAGSQLIGRFSPRQLNVVIGLLAVGFV